MMLLIFASFMWRYFGRRALTVALVIFVVFAFPRVMIGAHWFSDDCRRLPDRRADWRAVGIDDTAER